MNASRIGLLPMGIVNLDFLVDRLGQDCSLNQYLREQTQNAIEAIERTGRTDGHIIWDHFVTEDGVRKLCIIDNGDGMTGLEMLKYLNNLSCSLSEQDMSGNYGIGAKIAGATHSPEGLIYISKPDHDPDNLTYTVQLMRAEGKYGLIPFGDEGGRYEYYAEYPEDQLPDHFKTYASGTQVIILGKTLDADTAAGPSSQWVSQYLNRRYFTIPKGIKIQCREAKKTRKPDEDDSDIDDKNGLRPVRGQKWLLDGVALFKGIVELDTARAYWWIVPEDEHQFNPPLHLEGAPKPIKAMKSFHYSYNTKGHVGIVYQGELYDVKTGVPGYHVVQTFGVLLGASRVVIYIEPTSGALTTDTARTRVRINKEDAPWDDWATEFRSKMPSDLATFIESFDVGRSNSDDIKAIRAKVQEMLPLYNLDRYRKDPKGNKEIDTASDRQLPAPPPPHFPPRPDPDPHPTSRPPKPLFGKLKPGGSKGSLVRLEDIPDVEFLYGSEARELMGTTFAAHYVNPSLIQANGDFCIFQQLIDYFVAQYQEQAGVKSKIKQSLEYWVKLIIIDVVLSMRTLGLNHLGFTPWPSSELEKTLGDDAAFTMALAPRMLLSGTLKREIYRDLGKPQGEPDARVT